MWDRTITDNKAMGAIMWKPNVYLDIGEKKACLLR